jgi:hypothetical protein
MAKHFQKTHTNCFGGENRMSPMGWIFPMNIFAQTVVGMMGVLCAFSQAGSLARTSCEHLDLLFL